MPDETIHEELEALRSHLERMTAPTLQNANLRDDAHLAELAGRIRRLQNDGDETALQLLYESHDPGTIREAMATLGEQDRTTDH